MTTTNKDEKKNIVKIFKELKEMNVEERIAYLKKSNLTKTEVCDQLAGTPVGSLVINTISAMSDEDFYKFVASNIDKIPTFLIKKFS